jgi:small subunit ribosomal protein S8
MSVSDPVADMLTKIRNAAGAGLDKVDIMPSRMKLEIIKILKNEGYIRNFKKNAKNGRNFISIYLKYDDDRNSIIHGIKSISTPGRRVYTTYKKMPSIFNGFGTLIVSTSSGILTGKKAVASKVGGEIICSIW